MGASRSNWIFISPIVCSCKLSQTRLETITNWKLLCLHVITLANETKLLFYLCSWSKIAFYLCSADPKLLSGNDEQWKVASLATRYSQLQNGRINLDCQAKLWIYLTIKLFKLYYLSFKFVFLFWCLFFVFWQFQVLEVQNIYRWTIHASVLFSKWLPVYTKNPTQTIYDSILCQVKCLQLKQSQAVWLLNSLHTLEFSSWRKIWELSSSQNISSSISLNRLCLLKPKVFS